MCGTMSKIFIAVLFLLLSVCISQTKTECNFLAWQRVECGWSGISAFKCRRKGCCWDNRTENAIFCFKSDEKQTRRGAFGRINKYNEPFAPMILVNSGERSSMRTCLIRKEDRVACGWQPMSIKVCEDRGCCYDRSTRSGPRCYKPGDLLIGSRVRTLLQCTWQCTRTYWKRISSGYSLCGTHTPCWMQSVGFSAGRCLKTCKSEHDFRTYFSNVTHCLNLNKDDGSQTIRDCATHLPCWIEYHGQRAFTCFKKFEEKGKYQSVEIPEEVSGEDLRSSTKASIVIPRQPAPNENQKVPKEKGLVPKVSEVFKSLRTEENVEKAVHNRQIINEREERSQNVEK